MAKNKKAKQGNRNQDKKEFNENAWEENIGA